jgi:Trk-type K+ transport system membrane component
MACGTLVYYYGFPQTDERREMLLSLIKFSFSFYIVYFLLRFFYSYKPKEFLKENKIEAFMISFLFIEGAFYNITGGLMTQRLFVKLGFEGLGHFTAVFIQFYLLITFAAQLSRSSKFSITKVKMHPSVLFILSFFTLIMSGTFLLMMPEMTIAKTNMGFIDALFMSTSATCVTGLGVVDTASFFTTKGHIVILILIKLGGLNIIAFGTLVALVAKLGIGIKQHSSVEDFVNKDSSLNATQMFGKIIVWSTVIELVGAFFLYFLWSEKIPFVSQSSKVFSSIFHSVSAFNNAGLSLFTNGLYNEYVRDNYLVHLMVTIIVFWGALGFMSMFDMFSISKLRERLKKPWKGYEFSTKIALYVSLWLVAGGTLLFWWLEKDNTMKGMNFFEGLITSLFQSVTRTSGFNTVDISSMAIPSIIVMLFLMFVGSSSSSTGGGIKTSTFGIIWAAMISTSMGKKNIELFKKTISTDLVMKAFSVLLFFTVGNLAGTFLLSITEQHILTDGTHGILDLIFEQVSAFGTVGLSTGITGDLSVWGRVIISVSMFIGRVGTLTVAYAVGKSVISTMYKYPEGHTMVG